MTDPTLTDEELAEILPIQKAIAKLAIWSREVEIAQAAAEGLEHFIAIYRAKCVETSEMLAAQQAERKEVNRLTAEVERLKEIINAYRSRTISYRVDL